MSNLRTRLGTIINNNSTKAGRRFDYILQGIILLSLISFSLETLPDLSPKLREFLHIVDMVCLFIFSIEYILRIWVAKNPFKYIFSFYGIIDLLALLPFLLHSKFDLRALRAFRILRIFSVMHIMRYEKAMHRLRVAGRLIREEIVLFFTVTTVLLFLSASGIYFFENDAQPETFKSIFHSFWWAIVTLTTVGYGDIVPITMGGKVFTGAILIIGIGIVTVPAGLVATALNKARQIIEDEEKQKNE